MTNEVTVPQSDYKKTLVFCFTSWELGFLFLPWNQWEWERMYLVIATSIKSWLILPFIQSSFWDLCYQLFVSEILVTIVNKFLKLLFPPVFKILTQWRFFPIALRRKRDEDKHLLVAFLYQPSPGIKPLNIGMCPDWQSSPWPWVHGRMLQTTEPHHPGLLLPSLMISHNQDWAMWEWGQHFQPPWSHWISSLDEAILPNTIPDFSVPILHSDFTTYVITY